MGGWNWDSRSLIFLLGKDANGTITQAEQVKTTTKPNGCVYMPAMAREEITKALLSLLHKNTSFGGFAIIMHIDHSKYLDYHFFEKDYANLWSTDLGRLPFKFPNQPILLIQTGTMRVLSYQSKFDQILEEKLIKVN